VNDPDDRRKGVVVTHPHVGWIHPNLMDTLPDSAKTNLLDLSLHLQASAQTHR
jgi:hypothetical protein